jgi:uncharacterized protein (DUF2147 family)
MKHLLLVLAVLSVNSALAQNDTTGPADAVLHVWETQEKDGRLQMLKSGDSYYGKMIYGKDLVEADGVTYKKDIHNPDSALRYKSLKDFTLISGLIYKDGKWVNGRLYYYQDGNSYDCNIEIRDGALYMRVYKGIPMFGKTVKWHMVP